MPTYKLTYFYGKGLAESIRLLLSYKGDEFEDVMFQPEEWPSIKPTMPFGTVPILEIDGKLVHQSTAILRYLGKQAGLAGSNDSEALQIDMAVDTIHDFRHVLGGYFYEKDEAAQAKKKEIALKETVPFYLEKLNALVKENGGYLANGKLSWGDFCFVGVSEYLNKMLEFNIFDKYDALRQLKDNVETIPNVKAWIDRRPESEY